MTSAPTSSSGPRSRRSRTCNDGAETNEYWLAALAGAQTDPRKLEAIRTSVAQLEGVTADDIRREARAYLVDAKAWKLEVRPQTATP